MEETAAQIMAVVRRLGRLSELSPGEDFYAAGFSSVSALELLMELESTFDVSISDDQFIDARSVDGLTAMIVRLRQKEVA